MLVGSFLQKSMKMNNIEIQAIFSDDVRFEVGNKQSIIGIYNGVLFVQSFPTVIPKLCISFWITYPIDDVIAKFIFEVYTESTVLASMPISVDEVIFVDPANSIEPLTKRMINSSVMLSPFPIMERMKLKTRLIVDGVEYHSSSLHILTP